MCDGTVQKARICISWLEDGKKREVGPFWTISPDGSGSVIRQNWTAYNVQHSDGRFERITVPACHSIYAK